MPKSYTEEERNDIIKKLKEEANMAYSIKKAIEADYRNALNIPQKKIEKEAR